MTFDSQSLSEHPRPNCHIRTIKLCHICLGMKSNFKASSTFLLRVIINSDHSNFISISTADKSPLAQTLGSPALWNCLVTQRQLLPWANEHGVRCPLNKLQMPPSKETCSAPVSVATGSCLPGPSLKISLVTIKFLVKDYMWKELEWPRRPGLMMGLYKLLYTICWNYYKVKHCHQACRPRLALHGGYWCLSAGDIILVVCSLKGWKQRLHFPNEEVRTEQRLYSMNAMSSAFNLSYCGLCNPPCLKRSLGFVAETRSSHKRGLALLLLGISKLRSHNKLLHK